MAISSGSESATTLLCSCFDVDYMQPFYQNTIEIDERDDEDYLTSTLQPFARSPRGGGVLVEHEIEIDFNPKSGLHTIHVMGTQRLNHQDHRGRGEDATNSLAMTESVVIIGNKKEESSSPHIDNTKSKRVDGYSSGRTINGVQPYERRGRNQHGEKDMDNNVDDPTESRIVLKKRKGSSRKRGRSQTVRSHWDSRANSRKFV